MSNQKSGSRTLLMSVVMSAPGPLIVGIGMMMGKSSTQLADFVRRSSELLAIVVAYVIYTVTHKDADERRKNHLEQISNRVVGVLMCLSGASMLVIALVSDNTEKGNVIPGLAIAVLGVVANSLFWRKYAALSKQEGNAILAVQSRLYRAKTLVDICVTVALSSVALFPASRVSFYLDMIGSVIVASYLIGCGLKTIRESAI
jgi:divalent metal cation (Fe/Co/Zn/Cd) transporter